MADFLVVVGDSPRAEAWFDTGLRRAQAGLGAPSATLKVGSVRAAAWSRKNGSGGTIVTSEHGWLLAAGTWIHRDGLRSGQEVELLAALRGDRSSALDGLDGFFALAFGDARSASVVTDVCASHQVVTRRAVDAVATASSSLLLAGLEGQPELDSTAAQELLATGVIYEDRTLWQGVHKVGPGLVVDFDAQAAEQRTTWWSMDRLEPESVTLDDAVDRYVDGMSRSLQILMSGDDRPVCDLTAGWDSRILVASLLRAGAEFETTVTGPADSDDVTLSTRIAERLGLTHHVIPPVTAPRFEAIAEAAKLTDGEMNPLAYARILAVHSELSQRFSCSWNGSFGEVARAYWWEILSPGAEASRPLDPATVARSRYASGARAVEFWPAGLEPVAHFTDVVHRIDGEIERGPMGYRLDHTYLRLRMRSWQGRIASTTDRIWPCLSPLMFRAGLEPWLTSSIKDRQNHRLARRLITRLSPELARMPLENGGPALPLSLGNAWRFAPIAAKFAGKVKRKLIGGGSLRNPEEGSGPRMALWESDDLRSLLDPQRMKLGDLVDRDQLSGFLERSRQPQFDAELMFGRLIGLEFALRNVSE